MKFLPYLLAFALLMPASYSIIINEIMADPIADETLNEWIELYNNGSHAINVSGWVVGDSADNDSIEGGLYNKEGTIITAFGYAIITDDATRVYDNFNVSADAVRLYVNDSSIGNGLGNIGETIFLYDGNKNPVYSAAYNETTEGLSWSYLNGSLHKSNPTPGFNNDDGIPEQGCDYAVELIFQKTIFQNSSEFSFRAMALKIKGPPTNFTARAKIEGLNGNLLKEYSPFTNEPITTQRTSTEYSPNLEEGKPYAVSANISVQCYDINAENNFAAGIIVINGKPLQQGSSLNIADVYDLGTDKKAKFGQIIRIKLSAYKGNTDKESVAVWVEDKKGNRLSKQSKTNLDFKHSNYSVTLPIQIEPNCNEEFNNGEYMVKAKGLDSEDEEVVEIEGLTNSLCEVRAIKEKPISSKKFNFELQDFNNKIEIGKEFAAKVLLDNNNDAGMPIKVWSYVYRGSKSYSGNKEDNRKEFVLNAHSLQVIELSNIVDNAEPGEYKFKVVLNKNSQKTNEEIIKNITLNGNAFKAENVNVKSRDNNAENPENDEIAGDNKIGKEINGRIAANVAMGNGIVYQSTTEKAKNMVPAFLIVLLAVFNIVLVWRR